VIQERIIMDSKRLVGVSVLGALVLLALALTAISGGGAATAAPAAAPTPVSVTRPGGDGSFITFDLFNTAVLTEDTTSACVDIGRYNVADVVYSFDQGAGVPNTTTLTTQFSVDGGTLVSGVNVVASNAADATDMQQVQLFGRYFCLLANVSNTSAVTVTAKAIAK
jgi:hypothetical protein